MSKLDSPHQRHNFATLEPGRPGYRLLRHMYREAHEKVAQARNVMRAAEARLDAVARLARADGMADAFALLSTPMPAGPVDEPKVRVRSLAPFRRSYRRPVSAELARWLEVCEDVGPDELEQRFPSRFYEVKSKDHVLDLPASVAAELIDSGLAERVGSETPRQLPTGARY